MTRYECSVKLGFLTDIVHFEVEAEYQGVAELKAKGEVVSYRDQLASMIVAKEQECYPVK